MTRQFILFCIALTALLGSIVAVFGTILERDYQLRGYVDPTRDQNLPYRVVQRLGVNVELTQYGPDELAEQLRLMEAAHIVWIRQFFPWDEIEPEPGQYAWDKWDTIIAAVDQHPSLQLVAVLMNTPQWARSQHATNLATTPPDNPQVFSDFARAFAQRYALLIDYYQIWDEPNLTAAWGGFEPRPAQYAALLQGTFAAIHSADDSATIIAAALAPTTELGPDNVSDLLYLSDLYALGAQDYFDAAAAKPYGFDLPPSDRTVDRNVLNFSRIVALREIMMRYGDTRKPLWAASWGWNSLPGDWRGSPSIWGQIDQELHIAYTLEAIDRAEREWPWLGGMILQHWQPDSPADDPQWGFALIDQNEQPTVLWQTLAHRQPSSSSEDGLFHPVNPYASYSGVWTFGALGADIGWLQDSQATFNFLGTDVALLLRQDNYVAYVYPTIDGRPTNAAPRDASGNAYIVLTSNSLEPELNLVPVARDLPNGEHTLHMIADRGWDHWAIAGYAVSSGNLAAPYEHQIRAALFSVAIAAAALLATGHQLNWQPVLRPIRAFWGRLSDTGQLGLSAITSVALLVGMLLTWSEATPAIFRRDAVQLGLAILTAGMIYLQPAFVLTLAFIALLFVIVYNRTDIGLILTIFWSPFFLFPVELYRFAFPIAEVTILLTSAAWLLRTVIEWANKRKQGYKVSTSLANKTLSRRWTGLDYSVAAWVVLGFVSLSWAARTQEATTELRTMIVEPALFYMILRTTRPEKKTLVRLVDALLLAGCTVALIGLWLYFQGTAVITAEEGARRLASVYGSPNNVGLFLGRCIPFALAYTLANLDDMRRYLAAAIFMLMVLTVVLSQSAGAIFIGVPVAIAGVVLLSWGKRAWPALLGLVIATITTFAVLLQSARFARLLDFSSGTNFYRLRVWQSAVHALRDHPLTGLGLDQFLYAFRGHYIMPDAWQEPNLSHPHNAILDFWMRLGILGVGIFFWLQIAFWQTAVQVYTVHRNRDVLCHAIAIGVMGSMVNLLAHGMVDNSVYVQDLSYVFVLLLGVAATLSNIRAIDEPAELVV